MMMKTMKFLFVLFLVFPSKSVGVIEINGNNYSFITLSGKKCWRERNLLINNPIDFVKAVLKKYGLPGILMILKEQEDGNEEQKLEIIKQKVKNELLMKINNKNIHHEHLKCTKELTKENNNKTTNNYYGVFSGERDEGTVFNIAFSKIFESKSEKETLIRKEKCSINESAKITTMQIDCVFDEPIGYSNEDNYLNKNEVQKINLSAARVILRYNESDGRFSVYTMFPTSEVITNNRQFSGFFGLNEINIKSTARELTEKITEEIIEKAITDIENRNINQDKKNVENNDVQKRTNERLINDLHDTTIEGIKKQKIEETIETNVNSK